MTRLLVLDRVGGRAVLASRVADQLAVALDVDVEVVDAPTSSPADLATAVDACDAILELASPPGPRPRFADVASRHALAARDRPQVVAVPGVAGSDPAGPATLRPVDATDGDDEHGHVEVVANLFAALFRPHGDLLVLTTGTADGDAQVASLSRALGSSLGVPGTVRHAVPGLAVLDLDGRGRHLPEVVVLRDPAAPDPVLDARERGVRRVVRRRLATIPTDPLLVDEWVSDPTTDDWTGSLVDRTVTGVRRRSGGSWWSRRQEDDRAVPVELGASAPASAPPGAEVTIRTAAFPPRLREEARGLLGGLAGENRPALEGRTRRWAVGTDVEVRVSATGLDVAAPSQWFTWEDDLADLVFDARVHEDRSPGDVVVRADVLVADCPVARLRLPLTIAGGTSHASMAAPVSSPTSVTTTAATTAFASYATVDRPRVRERLAALEALAGLEVFADRDIRPGEDWRPRLLREIATRDLFLLFWSRAAASSTEIRWEMDQAEASPGRDAMRVHLVEQDAGPPPGWEHVHVGSTWAW